VDAQFQADGNHFPDGLDPFSVTGNARETSQFCPATVAIHDDGDVLR
jgi:hypothetical protein